MPPNRNRTSNPQGRQKSCSECAKAKRRCDLRQPSCLRCSAQDLSCIYPPRPCITETPSSGSESSVMDAVADEHGFPFDIPSLSNTQPIELLDLDFSADMGSIEALNGMLNDVEDFPPPTRQSSTSGRLMSAAHLHPFAQSRVEYTIEQLKLAPAMMVLENQTPWSHPCLYEDYMPRCLQDAHASCALHISRNETNATFVARHITDHVKECLEAPMPSAPTEVLARAHSLMLYQIILVFSEDIRYYGQAEAIDSHLENAGHALQRLFQDEDDPSGPLPLYPSIAARTAWKSFIFRESARRTFLIMFFFVALLNMLRGNLSCCTQALALGNRVTLSAHLWNAASAFDFAVAWNEKNHHLVKELNLRQGLEKANADEIDVFGRMVMTGVMGTDDVKGWFHTRGGVF